MVFFNYALRKLNAKIVYYGPGLCGKTTNLQWIHDHFEGGQKGKMISLATEGDRTIFFDLLPLEIGTIRGMEVTLQLYTVPGQVHYNSTRQLVLRGADGVVFVADSQRTMHQSNVDSLKNLQENLMLQGISLEKFPHAIQFNKRDLRDLLSPEELNQQVNPYGMPWFEAVATEGAGVQETLEGIVKLVMRSLRDRYETMGAQGPQPVAAPTAPAAPGGGQAGPWPVPPKGPTAPARPAATAQPPAAVAPPQQPVPPPPRPPMPDEEPTKVYGDRVSEPERPAAQASTPPAPQVQSPPPRQPQAPPSSPTARREQPPVTPPAARPPVQPAAQQPSPAPPVAQPITPPAADDDVDPHAITATGSLFGENDAVSPQDDDGSFPAFDDASPAPAPEPARQVSEARDRRAEQAPFRTPEPAEPVAPTPPEPVARDNEPAVPSWESESPSAVPVSPGAGSQPPTAAPAAAKPTVDPAATQRDQIQAPGPFAPSGEPGSAGAGNVDDLVASVLNRATSAALEAQQPPQQEPPKTARVHDGDREAVVVSDQEPFAEPVRTRASDLAPTVEPVLQAQAGEGADAATGKDANSLAVRLTGRGAIVERGQVSNLDIEVPVPGALVGNKRVTLQLRLTLTPVEEDADGGAS